MNPVEIRDLVFTRGTFRLDVPALTIQPGGIIGLVGRNGAGKSTLLELLVGLLRPNSGSVRVFDIDPLRDPVAARRRVGLMTDDMPCFPITVAAHMRALAPFYPTWDPALAAQLLERFELPGEKKVSALSKGEGTRARLAFTMAWRPELLLLDEPATGLDVPSRRAMLKELLESVVDPKRTVIVSSHNAADLERVVDQLLVIEDGRVSAFGTPSQVIGEDRGLEDVLAGGAR